MEGLEVSEVMLSELERTKRFDSEFYKKENLQIVSFLKERGCDNLVDLVNISDGNHMSISENFIDSGIPYYRGQDIHSFFIENASPIYISEDIFNKPLLKRSHLQKNDILLSIVGTIGKVAIVSTNDKATCSCKLAILRPKKRISSELLAVFLNSRYGQNQIQKYVRGAVQMGLILEDMNQLFVPIFSNDFDKNISKSVILSKQTLKQSQALYRQAEELLLETIGLKDFTPSQEKTNIKTFKESFLATGRLDAEYYQPKYEEIINVVKNYKNGFANFESFIDSYSTGYPYKSETYIEENGIPLVRINNLTKEGLDLSNAIQIPKEDLNLSKKDIAKEDDILISMSGTIGLSCIVREKNKIIINQRIMKITSKNYNPQVLSLLLNSIVGKYQLDRIGTGGVQTNVSSTDIKNILIPIIESEAQQQISALIQESFGLRKESERLLVEAKEMVEREIGGVK